MYMENITNKGTFISSKKEKGIEFKIITIFMQYEVILNAINKTMQKSNYRWKALFKVHIAHL